MKNVINLLYKKYKFVKISVLNKKQKIMFLIVSSKFFGMKFLLGKLSEHRVTGIQEIFDPYKVNFVVSSQDPFQSLSKTFSCDFEW